VLRIIPRHSNDVTYFTKDHALELEGLVDGPGWWLRGAGDTRDPTAVSQVLETTSRSNVQGYDLIFAAPRAISILVALDPPNAPAIIDAHRRSVASTVGYLEERAVVVRDRRDGHDVDEAGQWTNIVSFTHGVNRHGEPHLHDHVLVGARTLDARSVLDSRSLFVHAKAADALYRSELRDSIAHSTSWQTWRSFGGVEHVIGLDEGYRVLWGGHFADRGEKKLWRREEILDRWRDDRLRFEAHGQVRPPDQDRSRLDEHVFGAILEGSREISRRHLVLAWSNAASFGVRSEEVTRSIDELFPTLRTSRGVREQTVGVREARMTGLVRERGARPLASQEMEDWRQRSRERSIADERSR